jgi:hypothetical protein
MSESKASLVWVADTLKSVICGILLSQQPAAVWTRGRGLTLTMQQHMLELAVKPKQSSSEVCVPQPLIKVHCPPPPPPTGETGCLVRQDAKSTGAALEQHSLSPATPSAESSYSLSWVQLLPQRLSAGQGRSDLWGWMRRDFAHVEAKPVFSSVQLLTINCAVPVGETSGCVWNKNHLCGAMWYQQGLKRMKRWRPLGQDNFSPFFLFVCAGITPTALSLQASTDPLN